MNLVVFAVGGSCALPPNTTARFPINDRSCADVQMRIVAARGTPADGQYAIDPDGDSGPETPFTVYCDRMAPGSGAPREYLEVDPANNFHQSMTTALIQPALCACSWFRRSFSKVRLLISPPPIRYQIEAYDFTYSTRTLGPQNPEPGSRPCPVPEGGPLPEDDFASLCPSSPSILSPDNLSDNAYGRATNCSSTMLFRAVLGEIPGARVQLAGTGFRVPREEIASYRPEGHMAANQVVKSVNGGRGYEAQLTAFCGSSGPARWDNANNHVLDVERDIPVRESLGESCESPWLLENTFLGGDVDSTSPQAPGAGLCLGVQFPRNVRYYELRVPAGKTRTVVVSDMVGTDVLVRILDRCGATECVEQSSAQPFGTHSLSVQNATAADRSWIIAVSGKSDGNTFYRIRATAPQP